MTDFYDYNLNFNEMCLDEIPYIKDAFNEYEQDKKEVNDDEELYNYYREEDKYWG